MLTKVGRRGDKCKITFHNLSAENVLNMPIFTSIAWDFKKDRPSKEQILIVIYLQKDQLQRLEQLKRQDRNKAHILRISSTTSVHVISDFSWILMGARKSLGKFRKQRHLTESENLNYTI